MTQADKNQLFYELHATTQFMRTQFDRRATRLGLTRAQWRALKTISRFEGLSQSELAERLEMEPIPVGRVIDRLEKADFVERRADPGDRRRWQLYLKPKARAIVGEMDVIADGLRVDAYRGIKPVDLATAMRVLVQMRQNLADAESEPARIASSPTAASKTTLNKTRGKS